MAVKASIPICLGDNSLSIHTISLWKEYISSKITIEDGTIITVDFTLLWPRGFASLLGTWKLHSILLIAIIKEPTKLCASKFKLESSI